jgi:hypothetical protein
MNYEVNQVAVESKAIVVSAYCSWKEREMPNWVQNKLEITGSTEELDRLALQMRQPYDTEGYDFINNEVKSHTRSGEFLLWNIVSPTDLDTYYDRAKVSERIAHRNGEVKQDSSQLTADLESLNNLLANGNLMADYQNKIDTLNDWYYWNVREWGTKWEVDDCYVIREPNKLIYIFSTAWSPPISALNKLAEQYLSLTMTLKCHDEGDMFASEVYWQAGQMVFERPLDINHYLLEDVYGGCWVCKHTEPDNDYAEAKEHYKCPA